MMLKHKLAAILFCDIVGYTSTTQADESEAARQIEVHRRVLESVTGMYNGEILHYYGDGSLTIFPSVIDAVDAALEIQEQLEKETVPVRAGIHLGEIYFKDNQFIGDGINVASRIQAEAQPGTVLISETAGNIVRNKAHISLLRIGEKQLKNVEGNIVLYEISRTTDQAARHVSSRPAPKPRKKYLYAAGIIVLVILIMTSFWFSPIRQMLVRSSVASIAVLPLTSQSSEEENIFLSARISDDIRQRLARSGRLDVKSRSSSEIIQDRRLTAEEIRKQLGIEYLLEGSVIRNPDNLDINLSLVDVRQDRTLAPIQLSADSLDELFSFIDIIARRVLEAIDPSTDISAEFTGTPDNVSFTAYRNYVLGKSFLIRSGSLEDLEKSEAYFRQAIAEEPTFGKAYAGLAEVLIFPAAWGYGDMHIALAKARETAKKAIELAPYESETQYTLGTINEFEMQFPEARERIRLAIELDPSHALSYVRMARISLVMGQWQEAEEYARKARNVDPLSPIIASIEPIVLTRIGKYNKAVTVCRQALAEFPGDNNILFHLGEALIMTGQYDEAIDVLRSRTVPSADFNFLLAYAYAKSRQQDKAQTILDYLLDKYERAYVPPAMIGCIYYAMDDLDRTHEWLEKESNYFILAFPMFEPLYNDMRFADIYDFFDKPMIIQ